MLGRFLSSGFCRQKNSLSYVKWLTLATSITTLISVSVSVSVSGAWAFMGLEHPFTEHQILWKDLIAAIETGNMALLEQGVDQGAQGDCWFESAVASLAMIPNGARLISDMIVAAPGGWEVTFLDQPNVHHKVTEADVTAAHVRDNAKWADILQAALFQRFPALTHGVAGAHKWGAYMHKTYGQDNGQFGLSMLTGHKAEARTVSQLTDEELARIFIKNDGWTYALTAGTPNLPDATTPIPGNHVYSFLEYEPYSGFVFMRNPWGGNTKKDMPMLVQTGQTRLGITNLGNGVLKMRLATFKKYYGHVFWSRVFHQ